MIARRWIILKILLFAELTAYGYYYFQGYQGFLGQQKVIKHSREIEKNITIVQQEIQQLRAKILLFKTEPYYKEKIAREQLHMGFSHDIIYYITYN